MHIHDSNDKLTLTEIKVYRLRQQNVKKRKIKEIYALNLMYVVKSSPTATMSVGMAFFQTNATAIYPNKRLCAHTPPARGHILSVLVALYDGSRMNPLHIDHRDHDLKHQIVKYLIVCSKKIYKKGQHVCNIHLPSTYRPHYISLLNLKLLRRSRQGTEVYPGNKLADEQKLLLFPFFVETHQERILTNATAQH